MERKFHLNSTGRHRPRFPSVAEKVSPDTWRATGFRREQRDTNRVTASLLLRNWSESLGPWKRSFLTSVRSFLPSGWRWKFSIFELVYQGPHTTCVSKLSQSFEAKRLTASLLLRNWDIGDSSKLVLLRTKFHLMTWRARLPGSSSTRKSCL